jgi:hypothetical protein
MGFKKFKVSSRRMKQSKIKLYPSMKIDSLNITFYKKILCILQSIIFIQKRNITMKIKLIILLMISTFKFIQSEKILLIK